MMDSNLIPAKLIELNAAINDKTGKQCWQPDLKITASDNRPLKLTLWGVGAWLKEIRGGSLEAIWAEAHKFIRDLPSEADQNLAEFQADLAKLIDKGRDYNIDLDFVNPLIATSKALAENAITHHKDFATDEEMHGSAGKVAKASYAVSEAMLKERAKQ